MKGALSIMAQKKFFSVATVAPLMSKEMCLGNEKLPVNSLRWLNGLDRKEMPLCGQGNVVSKLE